MSVVQLDFFDREDLNGAVIFSCTDEDAFFEGFEQRIGLRDLGAGHITLSRQGVSAGDNPSFLFDVARSEAFVRVLVPAISSDYLFGFFLDNRRTHVLSDEEAAGQDIVIGGSGPLYYLSRAILWNEKFSSTAATVDPAAGLWRFPDNANWTPGKVFETLVSEDTNNSFSTVPFLPDLTLGFDNDDDSDGNAWTDTFEGGLQLAIGTHYLQALRIMQQQAEYLDAYMGLGAPGSPLMRLEMYNRYGRDLTGTSFGAGTVLWKGGISSDPLSGNILTGIEATGQSTVKPSHVLVKGPDGVYSQVDRGLWSPGDFTKAVAVDFDNTIGDDSLFRFGRRVMADWDAKAEGLQLEIYPGFDEALGHYMPGPDGSDGHFWIGDDVTLKTGGDAVHSVLDYHYTTERVTGVRMVLDEAVVDDTDETAALSWHIVPELNEVFGMEGSLDHGAGICCGPHPPLQPVPGTCTRLYPDNTSPAALSGLALDASWEDPGSPNFGTLITTADGDYPTTTQITRSATGLAGGEDQCYARWAIQMNSSLAAVLAAGGATIRGQFRGRARYGIGISESSQDMISQIGVRVTTGSSTTIRGTALALHSLASSAGSAKWPAQPTKVNRVFPPAAASNTLSAVSGATSGDWLVVEIGSRNYTTVTSGGAIGVTTDQSSDMPEDETDTNTLNTWIEICSGSGSSPGDTTQPVGPPGSASPGSEHIYAPIDHVHEHGLNSQDELHSHNATDVQYDPSDSGLGVNDVQAAIDALAAGVSAEIVDHGTMGATEDFDAEAGADHEGVLDTNLTVTLSGAETGVRSWLTLRLTQDGSGGNTITWPGSVAWPGGVAPVIDTTAGAVSIVTLFSDDGGTNWYGAFPGTGGSVADLDDLDDVIITTPVDGDVLTYNGTEWVNEAPAAGSGGGIGEILISDTPSTPLVFADLIQNEAQDDLVYGDP